MGRMNAQLLMKLIVCLHLLMPTSRPVSAEEATPYKCTCNLVLESPPYKNGAWVSNATSCWSHEYFGREWCTIQVATLEGTGQHNDTIFEVISTYQDGGSQQTAEFFRDLFTSHINEMAEAGLLPEDTDPENYLSVVSQVFESEVEQVGVCVSALNTWREKKEGLNMSQKERLVCGVGSSSGWFNIGVLFDDLILIFRTAPNG